MDERTGEIFAVADGAPIPDHATPLTPFEHRCIGARKQKERTAALKALRHEMIKAAKRAKGSKLTTEEVKSALSRVGE